MKIQQSGLVVEVLNRKKEIINISFVYCPNYVSFYWIKNVTPKCDTRSKFNFLETQREMSFCCWQVLKFLIEKHTIWKNSFLSFNLSFKSSFLQIIHTISLYLSVSFVEKKVCWKLNAQPSLSTTGSIIFRIAMHKMSFVRIFPPTKDEWMNLFMIFIFLIKVKQFW